MGQIEISDQVLRAAEGRAAAGGYSSVAEYVADLLKHDLEGDDADATPNLDHLFTPERLAEIEEAEHQIKSGSFFTAEQVAEHFKQKRAAWQPKNGAR